MREKDGKGMQAEAEKWFRFVEKVITIFVYRHRRHQDNVVAEGKKMYVSDLQAHTGANYRVYKSMFSITRRAVSRAIFIILFFALFFVIYYPGIYVSKRENRLSTGNLFPPGSFTFYMDFHIFFSLSFFTPVLLYIRRLHMRVTQRPHMNVKNFVHFFRRGNTGPIRIKLRRRERVKNFSLLWNGGGANELTNHSRP